MRSDSYGTYSWTEYRRRKLRSTCTPLIAFCNFGDGQGINTDIKRKTLYRNVCTYSHKHSFGLAIWKMTEFRGLTVRVVHFVCCTAWKKIWEQRSNKIRSWGIKTLWAFPPQSGTGMSSSLLQNTDAPCGKLALPSKWSGHCKERPSREIRSKGRFLLRGGHWAALNRIFISLQQGGFFMQIASLLEIGKVVARQFS